MNYLYGFLIFFLLPLLGSGQLRLVTPLQDVIFESSGLITLQGKLITHNDSGGYPALYELDSITGAVTRSVFIINATNRDWEDICHDGTYIYIADFGNNTGSRTDLRIYRIAVADYFSTPDNTVSADTINFSYADQTDFTPGSFSTNFDAEALITGNDSLYIFTKNWGNGWTNIYALPKLPGTYQTTRIDSINTQGLVTGAVYDSTNNRITLSGYTYTDPFLVEISDFSFSEFSSGTIDRLVIPPPQGFSIQVEGITTFQSGYYLTAEVNTTGEAALYRLDRSLLSSDDNTLSHCSVYPNPATSFIRVHCADFSTVELYDMKGVLQKTSDQKQIDISRFRKGTYLLIVKNKTGKEILSEKVIFDY